MFSLQNVWDTPIIPANRVGPLFSSRQRDPGDVPGLPYKDEKSMIGPIRKHRTQNEITGDAP
jgi:hypothetical protein